MAGAGRIGRRLVVLYTGLVLLGSSMAWMVRADLGLSPWDVFHQGVADRTGLSFGSVVIAVGVVVMLLWIPLRQVPGLGTISNAIVVGLAADATLAVLSEPHHPVVRGALLVSGVVANGFATSLYISTRFGAGPRDGVMTGLARRGRSLRVVRTAIELTALTGGLLLGGTVGLGTVLYAVSVGPLVHFFLPRLTTGTPASESVPEGDVAL
jgi:uncharacterized membrane protein YczE